MSSSSLTSAISITVSTVTVLIRGGYCYSGHWFEISFLMIHMLGTLWCLLQSYHDAGHLHPKLLRTDRVDVSKVFFDNTKPVRPSWNLWYRHVCVREVWHRLKEATHPNISDSITMFRHLKCVICCSCHKTSGAPVLDKAWSKSSRGKGAGPLTARLRQWQVCVTLYSVCIFPGEHLQNQSWP